jgi:hypothetical protein
MSDTPSFTTKDVSRKQAESLFAEHNFDQRIALSREWVIYETPLMHATFCCHQRLCRYIELATDEEIATIAHVTYPDGHKPPKRVITELIIGNVIYLHEFHPHGR